MYLRVGVTTGDMPTTQMGECFTTLQNDGIRVTAGGHVADDPDVAPAMLTPGLSIWGHVAVATWSDWPRNIRLKESQNRKNPPVGIQSNASLPVISAVVLVSQLVVTSDFFVPSPWRLPQAIIPTPTLVSIPITLHPWGSTSPRVTPLVGHTMSNCMLLLKF